ncbi:MOSC domain-containing protein [Massilia niastensis]|uniref:MOSC domain-containing protein n=1 Tax=Massilia niastensis TaxID=544911 RepID=UPI00037BF754|nr:MOSC domain-containing protein [Massilia niastensis]
MTGEALDTGPGALGRLRAVALRTAPGAAPVAVPGAEVLGGAGLAGDIHADPLSPRQVLLAGAAAYQALRLPRHALRENLLLDADTAGLRSGMVLQLGADVLLQLMFQCEACGSLDAHSPGLARAIGPRRGMLARVLAGGRVQAGDPVRSLGLLLPPWSDDWRERVRRVLDAAPSGMVVEYRVLARLAGIAPTYCRAFPSMLRRLGPAYAAGAVPARSARPEARWDGAGLFDLPPASAHWLPAGAAER